MHYWAITRFIAILVLFLGISMGAPLLASLFSQDGAYLAFSLSMLISIGLGASLVIITKDKATAHLSHRDGIAIVTFGWIIAGFVGTLPYILSGSIPEFTNAYFESISGFTTTGATIITDISVLPKGILLWRSQTQWFGGMGIIVLSIAILPFLGIGGMQVYKAEIPGPVVDKLKPRISETAKILWKVYIAITAVEIALLFAGGMSLFDSVCHAFCTMPTGGFSTNNGSIAEFNSAYFDGVIVIFMLFAGINFSLHYKLIKGGFRGFAGDSELRFFLLLVGICTALVTLNLYGSVYASLSTAFRHAIFQVTSIITTTGFVTADYDLWPDLSRHILLFCMFFGAMAGSTGGGIKILRIMLLVKHGYQEIFRIVHPRAVTKVKLGERSIPADVMASIWGFFILYMTLFLIATLIMTSMGLDMVSATASAAASIGNIGPGLGLVGPAKNYLSIPWLGKWVLVFCMLLGRLEIYTVIVLLLPPYWRK